MFGSGLHHGSLFLQTCIIIMSESLISGIEPPIMPNLDHLKIKPKIENLNKIPLKGKPVPPCIACQSLVKSFLTAVAKTTRESFAGGDAYWEREKLGSYENSELRFIEIQEMLCADVEFGKDQCYNLAEQYESELEDWFYENRKKDVDLHHSLCINHIKACCPNNTYGPNCVPCPGGIENPCGGHGKCRKGGTREEPASCVCDSGYAGELCDECSIGYYKLDGSISICKKCYKACKDHCRGPGQKNCEVCADGYHFSAEEGCIDNADNSKSEDEASSSDSKSYNALNHSEQSNESDEFPSKDDEEMELKPSIEDSTSNLHHSEL